MVRARLGVSWSRAKALCAEGRVTLDGAKCLDATMRVGPTSVVEVNTSAPKLRTEALPRDAIVHADRDVVVIDKPAGLLSVADGEGSRETAADHLRTLLRKRDGIDAKLGVVHRIDRDTSGLMAFARNAAAQRSLAAQFRAHEIDRVYEALAHGVVAAATFDTFLLRDRGDGLRGSFGHYRHASGEPPGEARRSITHVRPLEVLSGATRVECRLETGRQHQIRIHMAEAGHPLLGEQVYVRDFTARPIAAPRTMLHARTLGFVHPRTGRPMVFQREPPQDFIELCQRLRVAA